MKSPGRIADCKKKGFVLVAFTLSLMFVLDAAGLTFDVGRICIGRNEAQTHCDAAALYAAWKLDGKLNGIAAVSAAALATPKLWEFGTRQTAVKLMQDRAASDANAKARNFKAYVRGDGGAGNSRRIVVVPMVTGVNGVFGRWHNDANCPASPDADGPLFHANVEVGFASFFPLTTSQYDDSAKHPVCAEYVGFNGSAQAPPVAFVLTISLRPATSDLVPPADGKQLGQLVS